MRKKNIRKKSIIILSAFIVITIGLVYLFYLKINDAITSINRTKYEIRGIDVSHHNPILDWNEVKNQNIIFAYIKATEGVTHDDRNYPYNYKLARGSKIKIGSYHFYSFGISGKDQARHFINTATCQSGDLIPAIDVEHSPSNPFSRDSAYIKNVIKELEILENELYNHYGIHPMIYTNLHCYKLYIEKQFANNPIWISSLKNEPSNDVKNWVIWQYTHKGELPGVIGDIDFNYFRYSFEEFKDFELP